MTVTASSQGEYSAVTDRRNRHATPERTVSLPVVPPAWLDPLTLYRSYLIAAGRAHRTVRLRLHYLGRLAAALPDPADVQPADLLGWLAGPDWSAETRKSARSSIAGFFRWALDYGVLPSNPARLLPAVRIPRALPRPAPVDVIQTALGRATPRDRLMIMLGVYAGLRRAEIAGLMWSDIGPDSVHVTGKGGRQRIIPLLPDVAGELHAARRSRGQGSVGRGWRYVPETFSPYVFPASRGGGHMHPDTVGKLLTGLLGAGWTGHTLRHRFGTAAYAGTHDIRAVQELLGHASPATTARYTAVADEQLRAAVESAGRIGRPGLRVVCGQPGDEPGQPDLDRRHGH